MTTPISAAAFLVPVNPLQVGVGPYGHDIALQPLAVEEAPALDGFDLVVKDFIVSASEEHDSFPSAPAMVTNGSVRLAMFHDESGIVQIDQLLLHSPLAALRVRPQLGDDLDLAFIGGRSQATWRHQPIGDGFLHLFSPSHLTLLGFANTDEDDDNRLKHYFSIGLGLGAEVTAKLVGPLGVHFQGVGEAGSRNRRRKGDKNTVRHETNANIAAGLVWMTGAHHWVLDGWLNQISQWDTRTVNGVEPSPGVDRQYLAAGLRLTVFFRRTVPLPVAPIDADSMAQYPIMESAPIWHPDDDGIR